MKSRSPIRTSTDAEADDSSVFNKSNISFSNLMLAPRPKVARLEQVDEKEAATARSTSTPRINVINMLDNKANRAALANPQFIIPNDGQYINYLSDALNHFVFLPTPATSPAASSVPPRRFSSRDSVINVSSIVCPASSMLNATIESIESLSSTKTNKNTHNNNNNNNSYYEFHSSGSIGHKIPVVSALSTGTLPPRTSSMLSMLGARADNNNKLPPQQFQQPSVVVARSDVYDFKQSVVPQRHVDVTLMKDRRTKRTDYRGPHQLNSADYLRKNMYMESLEFQ